MDFVTGEFRVSPETYARVHAQRLLPGAAVVLAVVFIGLVIAAAHDSRFYYVMAIVLFTVVPMIGVLAWLMLVGRPEVYRLCVPQTWRLSDAGDLEIYSGDTLLAQKNIADIKSTYTTGRFLQVRFVGGEILLLPLKDTTKSLAQALINMTDSELA